MRHCQPHVFLSRIMLLRVARRRSQFDNCWSAHDVAGSLLTLHLHGLGVSARIVRPIAPTILSRNEPSQLVSSQAVHTHSQWALQFLIQNPDGPCPQQSFWRQRLCVPSYFSSGRCIFEISIATCSHGIVPRGCCKRKTGQFYCCSQNRR